jgi:hypothetical protein
MKEDIKDLPMPMKMTTFVVVIVTLIFANRTMTISNE